jgi:hypothetical protein
MKYSVKLYGHLSEDKDRFSAQLADVLDMDQADASALMEKVPVMVLAGASKHQAERLARDLASIRALYLVEPEGGQGEPEEPPAERFLHLEPEPPATAEEDREESRKGYWGLALFSTVVGIVMIVGLGALLSLYEKVRTENQPAVTAPQDDTTGSQTRTDTPQDQEARAELEERIASLEKRNEEIKTLIELKRQDIDRQMTSSVKDMNLMRRSRQELAELGHEFKSNVNTVRQLEEEIRQNTIRPPVTFQ